MLFNSFPFIALVLVTLLIYYQMNTQKMQVIVLIFSSFVFYAYSQPYLLFLLLSSASINAIVSYKVYFENNIKKKKIIAFLGVAFNLLVLIFFKYTNLLVDFINITNLGDLLVTIPLPVGISFYTFQGISLVVDLYRSNHQSQCPLFKVNKNFKQHYIETLFFISFFPQLVAGPIVKAYQFYPQIKTKYFKEVELEKAFKVIILGYFLKMVIADNLKEQTFWMAYPYFETMSSLTLITLLFGYSIQIFADFAGYSLIAIGIAKLFGYNLPQNFNYPYIAKSFSEFWARWHISLSSWLKEYLYIPLGGNRVGKVKVYLNLYIVMLLGGLWHGAAWSYMIWGGYHGLLLIIERLFVKYIRLPKYIFIDILKVLLVFSLVTLGWLLFKLPEYYQAYLYIKMIVFNSGVHRKEIILMIFLYSLPIVLYYMNYLLSLKINKNIMNHSFVYAILLFFIITNSGSSSAFIYFQF